MKPKLIKNWDKSYRWFSMQAMAIVIAIHGSVEALNLMGLQAVLPHQYVGPVTLLVLVLGAIGRLVDQDGDATAE